MTSRIRLFRAGLGHCLSALSRGEVPEALGAAGLRAWSAVGVSLRPLSAASHARTFASPLVSCVPSVSARDGDARTALGGFCAAGLPRSYSQPAAAAATAAPPSPAPPSPSASPAPPALPTVPLAAEVVAPRTEFPRLGSRDGLPRPTVIDTLEMMRRFQRAGMPESESEAVARSGELWVTWAGGENSWLGRNLVNGDSRLRFFRAVQLSFVGTA